MYLNSCTSLPLWNWLILSSTIKWQDFNFICPFPLHKPPDTACGLLTVIYSSFTSIGPCIIVLKRSCFCNLIWTLLLSSLKRFCYPDTEILYVVVLNVSHSCCSSACFIYSILMANKLMFSFQQLLQDLGKLSVQYCAITIVELQWQQRLLISGGWWKIQQSLLNILLVHINEETLSVKMTLQMMHPLKVPMDCSQNLSTWHGKLLLLKAVVEATGIDTKFVFFIYTKLMMVVPRCCGLIFFQQEIMWPAGTEVCNITKLSKL